MKQIILCADDFGYNAKINQGVITLLQNNRISATSCMTNMPAFKEGADELRAFQNHADIGLHFNLPYSISTLLIKSHLRLLKFDEIYQALETQYKTFVEVLGFTPSHIDGHQHIHHLPIIRDVLVKFINDNQLNDKLYVRNVNPHAPASPIGNFIKTQIIIHTGAKQLHKLLHQHQIKHNQSFSGIYTFGQVDNYREKFLSFINAIDDNPIIMCHPGFTDDTDVIGKNRLIEFEYFNSSQFIDDMQQLQFQLHRFV